MPDRLHNQDQAQDGLPAPCGNMFEQSRQKQRTEPHLSAFESLRAQRYDFHSVVCVRLSRV